MLSMQTEYLFRFKRVSSSLREHAWSIFGLAGSTCLTLHGQTKFTSIIFNFRSPPEDFEFEVYLAVRSLEKATAASFEGLDDLAPPLLLSLYTMQPSEASR